MCCCCVVNNTALFLPDATGRAENMTDTEKNGFDPARQRMPEQNGKTAGIDDAFDEPYKEKEGVMPPMRIVWRNVVLMTFLHIGGVYGLSLIPSAKALTLVWGGFVLLVYSMHRHLHIYPRILCTCYKEALECGLFWMRGGV